MNYQIQSPLLSGMTRIPTVAYLAIYPGDDSEVYCMDVRDKFVADPTSAVAADGIVFVNRLNGGRWHRRCNPDVYWQSQSELWYDASLGFDTNPGTPTQPIKTMGEFLRRLGASNGTNPSNPGILYTAANLSVSESALFYQFTANNNKQWSTVSGAQPVTPSFWYDARDIKGLGDGNATLTDGQSLAGVTWVNKGSVASANLTVIAGAPTLKKVASAGKLRNASSVAFGGSEYWQSGALAGLTSPITWVAIFRFNSLGTFAVCDGKTNRNQLYTSGGTWALYGGSGGNVNTGGDNPPNPTANTYNFASVAFIPNSLVPFAANGFIADPSGTSSPGVCTMIDGITIGAGGDASSKLSGEIVSLIGLTGGANSHDMTAWNQWIQYNFGTGFPQ